MRKADSTLAVTAPSGSGLRASAKKEKSTNANSLGISFKNPLYIMRRNLDSDVSRKLLRLLESPDPSRESVIGVNEVIKALEKGSGIKAVVTVRGSGLDDAIRAACQRLEIPCCTLHTDVSASRLGKVFKLKSVSAVGFLSVCEASYISRII